MKILPNLKSIKLNACSMDVELIINESNSIKYSLTKSSNNEILSDLIEHKAYATTFLFLNENYKLEIDKDSFINESNVIDFYNDCEELLNENVKVVTEKGPLLVSIKGYPIYEVENGILRGSGEKKIFESFEDKDDYYRQMDKRFKTFCKNMKLDPNNLDSVLSTLNKLEAKYGDSENEYKELKEFINKELKESENWTEDELQKVSKYMKKLGNMSYEEFKKELELAKKGKSNKIKIIKEEGTQVSDIAPKLDQDLGINKPKIVSTKINGLKENVSLRGFLRNNQGQYERGNYILCQENNQYIILNKNKLK